MSLEHSVGFSQANRREARELGLLYKQKFLKPNASEWSRWSVMSVFAGNSPTQILVLMENMGLIKRSPYLETSPNIPSIKEVMP